MHFRAPDNSIHYLDDPAFLSLLPAGSVAITEEQVAAARAPSPDEMLAMFTAAIQQHIDAVAQAWGYDNIYTAATYAEEPAVPKFQREAKALRAWRSEVWAACAQGLADVEAGRIPWPEPAALLAWLPTPPARPKG